MLRIEGVTELATIEQRIARAERVENTVSLVCGLALAGVYVIWQLFWNHFLPGYTWMIPFGVGYVAPRIGFAVHVQKLATRRRELVHGPEPLTELPAARVISAARPSVPAATPVPLVAPVREPPAGDDPAILK